MPPPCSAWNSTNRGRRVFTAWRALFAVLLLTTALFPPAAHAYIPLPETRVMGDRSGLLLAAHETSVRIESVDLEVQMGLVLEFAEVQWRYEMRNNSAKASDTEMLFLIQSRTNGIHPEILVDDVAIPFERFPDNGGGLRNLHDVKSIWRAQARLPLLDPLTAQEVPDPLGGLDYADNLTVLLFRVPFAPGAAHRVTVRHMHEAGWDGNLNLRPNRVYFYEYLLAPASYWNSHGPLTVTILPAQQVYFVANLPFEQEGHGYRSTFDGLPGHDLTFSVMSTKGMIPGITGHDAYPVLLTILSILIGIVLGGRMGWRWKRGDTTVTSGLGCLFSTVCLALVVGIALRIGVDLFGVDAYAKDPIVAGFKCLVLLPFVSLVASGIAAAR